MKFFCIGLTKTGTTSFNSLMGSIGYKTHGYSRKLLNEYLDGGGIGPNIRRAIDQHDAFDDWPWPFLYRELLQELGDDAVFVLTRRSSRKPGLRRSNATLLALGPNGFGKLHTGPSSHTVSKNTT